MLAMVLFMLSTDQAFFGWGGGGRGFLGGPAPLSVTLELNNAVDMQISPS